MSEVAGSPTAENRFVTGDPAVELSSNRTAMSFERTAMSTDRTLMSVVRTSLSLISFGFTIFQFFHLLNDQIMKGGLDRSRPADLDSR